MDPSPDEYEVPEDVLQWLEENELVITTLGASDPELDAAMDRLLEKAAEARALIARNAETAAARVAHVRDWQAEQDAPLHRRLEWLEREARSLVTAMRFPGKTKSRVLPYGKVGFMKARPHVEVLDAKAAGEFAIQSGLDYSVVVGKTALAEFAKQHGNKLPEDSGAKYVVPDEDVFFFTPTGV